MTTGSTITQPIGILYFGITALKCREIDLSSPAAAVGASGTSSLIPLDITQVS